jgi:hypothetical protein
MFYNIYFWLPSDLYACFIWILKVNIGLVLCPCTYLYATYYECPFYNGCAA